MDSFQFRRPVGVGCDVSIYASLIRSGRSSMTIDVEAWRRARDREDSKRVTKATFVFVALDDTECARPTGEPGPSAALRNP